VRKSLDLDGHDDRCPSGRVPLASQLQDELVKSTAIEARDLWLCARAHLGTLPDVRPLASQLASQGLDENDPTRARELFDAASTLDPAQVLAAHRLLELRLARSPLQAEPGNQVR
jgi:hypothetical protein